MNKKVQALIVTGVISLSSLSAYANSVVFADSNLNNIIQVTQNIKNSKINKDGTISNPDGTKTVVHGGSIQLENEISVIVPEDTKINKDGTVVPPENGYVTLLNDEMTIYSGKNGEAPKVNPNGTIVVPNEASIETGTGTFEVPGGSIVNPGTDQNPYVNISIKNEGEVVLPNGTELKVPSNTIIKPTDAFETVKIPSKTNLTLVTDEGNITVESSSVKVDYQENIKTSGQSKITLPGNKIVTTSVDTTVNNDGSITIESDGSVILPNGKEETVYEGNTIQLDGTLVTLDNQLPDGDDWYDEYYDNSYDDDWYYDSFYDDDDSWYSGDSWY